MPIVSVIVGGGRRPHEFRRTLDSVLRQDVAQFEVIVVYDDVFDGATFHDERVRAVRSPHRRSGAARMTGFDAARGRFAAYCDEGDIWSPGHLTTLLTVFGDYPETVLAYGDVDLVDDTGAPMLPPTSSEPQPRNVQVPLFHACGVLHRVEAARVVGGFDAVLEAYEDWDLWLRMSHWDVFRHVPAVVATRTAFPLTESAQLVETRARRRISRHLRSLRIDAPIH